MVAFTVVKVIVTFSIWDAVRIRWTMEIVVTNGLTFCSDFVEPMIACTIIKVIITGSIRGTV